VQARIILGSLKSVGRAIRDDEDDFLELPRASDADDEEVGVLDADELLFSDIGDESEDVGLDADPLGIADGMLALDDEKDDGTPSSLLDDAPLELDAEVDAEGEEGGWTEDNEGSGELWEDDLAIELPSEAVDEDAGEEGVDDPLLDGLPDERAPALSEDDDEDDEGDSWMDEELLRDIGADA
jgi:hypothetical protein